MEEETSAFMTSIRPKLVCPKLVNHLNSKSKGPGSPVRKCHRYAANSNIHELGNSWSTMMAPELFSTPTRAKESITACFSPKKIERLTPQLEDVMEDHEKFELLKQKMREDSGCFTPMSLGENLGELLEKISSHSR